MCPLPSRAEEKWREVKERKGNSSSSHCQHNCQGGRILLVKHWAGMFIFHTYETISWFLHFNSVFTSLNDVFSSIRLWKLNSSLKFMRRGSKHWVYKKPQPKVSPTEQLPKIKHIFGQHHEVSISESRWFWFTATLCRSTSLVTTLLITRFLYWT